MVDNDLMAPLWTVFFSDLRAKVTDGTAKYRVSEP